MFDGFLTQHVLFPTRENNCLDLVFSTDESMVKNVASGGKVGSSDHDLISFDLCCFSNFQGSNRTVLDFSKADFDRARELLNRDWTNCLSLLGPAEAWSFFRDVVTNTTKLCIPLKKAVVKNRPNWISREVLRAVRKKRKCWRRYRESKDTSDFTVYKNQELVVKKLVDDAKARFEKQLAREVKVNPKSFPAYVRSKQEVKEGIGPLQGSEGTLVSDHQGMANLLNDYFVSVLPRNHLFLILVRVLTLLQSVMLFFQKIWFV